MIQKSNYYDKVSSSLATPYEKRVKNYQEPVDS